MNIILQSDSYKYSMWNQYPPGTTKIYSYLESRGGKFANTVFFGLQYYLKALTKPITMNDINEAQDTIDRHIGPGVFYRAGWEHILNKHNGYLPVRICAVPEGTIVPTNNVLLTIENTDPECFWLTTFLETYLMKLWYPITVATIAIENRNNVLRYLNETGDPNNINFCVHDFGFRGVSSCESAAIGGAAHLVASMGTDNLGAISLIREHYSDNPNYMPAFSIPAMEHSTVTSWGRDHETDAFSNMLDKYPTGLAACVSDSYDIFACCEKIWGEKLKDRVLARNGTLVIRPDSGDPCEVTLKILNILGDKFGYNVNQKGFKVLPPQVKIIQGDGISVETIPQILENLKKNRWSADNIAFGSGGALLQKMDRDTQRMAIKCSYAEINGVGTDVYKQPATDSVKNSKRGRLKLISDYTGEYTTISASGPGKDMLRTVFENGTLVVSESFETIRSRATT